MNISGSGTIAAGEYNDKITVSGSGRLDGNIRCQSLHCSGSVKGNANVVCVEEAKISGSCHIEQSLSAQNISVSGSLKVGGDVIGKGEVKLSGGISCGGSLKCESFDCSGGLDVGGEIAAEEIRISGAIKCGGLMNAEKIDINIDGHSNSSRVGSIGGGEIKIQSKANKLKRKLLLNKIIGCGGRFSVDEYIEGDVVTLEDVTAPKVVGRIVSIGAGCEVDFVQYSENIEIHSSAKVAKYEKI